jgi:hypothetical protein
VRGEGRALVATGDAYVLREELEPYEVNFTPENRTICAKVGLLVDGFS